METRVTATGPSGFAGAGRIMCNALEAVADLGLDCMFVGPDLPFPWRGRSDLGIEVRWRDEAVSSNAIGHGAAISDRHVLQAFELAEELVVASRRDHVKYETQIIWAHYLFPYAIAALMATEILRSSGINVSLWINPAGSDIWEVGPQIKHVTSATLNSPVVDRIVTYSSGFAEEIAANYGLDRKIDILKPHVERAFYPLPTLDREAARRRLGIAPGKFMISSHSNMRPVKAPDDVVATARRASAWLPERNVSLYLAGPKKEIVADLSDLEVKQLGVVSNMAEVLQAADLEVNLSVHDSFNLSLAEAMKCGIPVVTTNVAGITADVIAAGAGFAVPLEEQDNSHPRNRYHAAVDSIVRFGSSESFRRAAGMRASTYSAREFSTESFQARIGKLLAEPTTEVRR